jgi:hypothetical protein
MRLEDDLDTTNEKTKREREHEKELIRYDRNKKNK